jgi:hypothetical protein
MALTELVYRKLAGALTIGQEGAEYQRSAGCQAANAARFCKFAADPLRPDYGIEIT